MHLFGVPVIGFLIFDYWLVQQHLIMFNVYNDSQSHADTHTVTDNLSISQFSMVTYGMLTTIQNTMEASPRATEAIPLGSHTQSPRTL